MTDKERIIGYLDAFGVMDWRCYHDGHIVKTLQDPPRRLVFDDAGKLYRYQILRRDTWEVLGESEEV